MWTGIIGNFIFNVKKIDGKIQFFFKFFKSVTNLNNICKIVAEVPYICYNARMSQYSFEYPWVILFIIPIIYCIYRCKEPMNQRFFVHLHLLNPSKYSWLKHSILLVTLFVLLLIALASPLHYDADAQYNRQGRDIVLAIDASGSMNSSGFIKEGEHLDFLEDEQNPQRLTRFEVTKLIAKEFILGRQHDNVGVVLYGDYAFIASPITYEKEIVADMLSYLTQGMAGQNTAIGEAIAIGARAFAFSHAKSRVMILLSDGEHNSGSISPKDAIEIAKKERIKIYTIGIGNEGEADSALLEQIAKESGGEFYYATSSKALQEVYEKIDELEISKIKSSQLFGVEYFYQIPLFIAALIVLFFTYQRLKS